MSYAPILNPSVHTGKALSWRRASLAAAVVLQGLAEGNAEELKKALNLIDLKIALNKPPNAQKWLANLSIIKTVSDSTGIPHEEILSQLIHQLREVKAFGELDGEQIDDYIKPVARLIKSGRIELFVG